MSQFHSDMLAVIRCGDQYRNEQVAPYGLRACHIGYLSRICYHPGISQDRLAQMMFVNKSNAARQAVLLEKEGFITRTPSASDKRVMELNPTQKALDLMPELRRIVEAWDDVVTADLSPEEVEVVTRLVARLKEKAATYMAENP